MMRSLARSLAPSVTATEKRSADARIFLQEAFFLSILRLQDKFDSGTFANFTDILGSSKEK